MALRLGDIHTFNGLKDHVIVPFSMYYLVYMKFLTDKNPNQAWYRKFFITIIKAVSFSIPVSCPVFLLSISQEFSSEKVNTQLETDSKHSRILE